MNHHHSNPTLSILLGSIFGIFNYFLENQFLIENLLSVFKVIVFGIIGGASGYIGRLMIIAISRKFKRKAE